MFLIFVFALGCPWVKFLYVLCSSGVGLGAQGGADYLTILWHTDSCAALSCPNSPRGERFQKSRQFSGLLVQMGKTSGKRQMLVAIDSSCSPWTRLTGSVLENKSSESHQALVSPYPQPGRHVSLRDKAGLA